MASSESKRGLPHQALRSTVAWSSFYLCLVVISVAVSSVCGNAPRQSLACGFLTVDADSSLAATLASAFRHSAAYYVPSTTNVSMKLYDAETVSAELLVADGIEFLFALDNAARTAWALAAALPSVNVSLFGILGNTGAPVELDNVDVVDIPLFSSGFEAGALAGLLGKTVLVVTDGYYDAIAEGVRLGLLHSCPLCRFLKYELCSVQLRCAGDWERVWSIARFVDIIVFGTLGAGGAFREFVLEMTWSTSAVTPYAIYAGLFSTSLPESVTSSSQYVAHTSYDLSQLFLGSTTAALGTFQAERRKITATWSTVNVTNSSSSIPRQRLSEAVGSFARTLQAFRRGIILPDTSTPQSDFAFSDSAPFVGIGALANGVGATLPSALTLASACVVGNGSVMLLHSNLSSVSIFEPLLGHFRTVPLNMSLSHYQELRSQSSKLLTDDYDDSRYINSSAVVPRVNMTCHYVVRANGLVEVIFEGGMTPTNPRRPMYDVLRLRYVCVEPVVNCDFLVLDNVTDAAPRDTDGVTFGGGFVSASKNRLVALSTAADVLQVFDANNSYAALQRVSLSMDGSSSLLPFNKSSVIQFVMWVKDRQAFVGIDTTRSVVVHLELGSDAVANGTLPVLLTWRVLIPSMPTAYVDCVSTPASLAYVSTVNSIALLTQVYDTTAASYSVRLYRYSFTLQRWILRSSYIPVTPAQRIPFFIIPALTLGGGGSILYPLSDATAELVVMSYAATAPQCLPEQVPSVGASKCAYCSANEYRTLDGFCEQRRLALADVLSSGVTAGIIVGCIAAVSLGVAATIVIRRAYGSSRRRLKLEKQTRSEANAPPAGQNPILVVSISDANVILYGAVRDGNSSASSHDGDGRNGSFEVAKGSFKDLFFKKSSQYSSRDVLDYFCESLSQSVVANACYLAEFRGDFAIVVSASASDLLCVAVEVSFAMASREQPIRLSCGLHYDLLACTKDPAMDRTLYSGQAIRATTRIASMSKQGSIVASEAFEAQVGDAALKHLGIVRGLTGHVRYDNSSITVRDLTLHSITELFSRSTSAMEAKARRQHSLLQKRQQTRSAAAKNNKKKKTLPAVIDALPPSIKLTVVDDLQKQMNCDPTAATAVATNRLSHSAIRAASLSSPANSGEPDQACEVVVNPLLAISAIQPSFRTASDVASDDHSALIVRPDEPVVEPSAHLGIVAAAMTPNSDSQNQESLGLVSMQIPDQISARHHGKQQGPADHSRSLEKNTKHSGLLPNDTSTSADQAAKVLQLTSSELRALKGLAASVARVLLTNLSSELLGARAFSLLVSKLHLPGALSSNSKSHVKRSGHLVTHQLLQTLAQRVVSMTPELAHDVHELADIDSTCVQHNSSPTWWCEGIQSTVDCASHESRERSAFQ